MKKWKSITNGTFAQQLTMAADENYEVLARNYGGGGVADKYLILPLLICRLVTSGTFHGNYLLPVMTGNIWLIQNRCSTVSNMGN